MGEALRFVKPVVICYTLYHLMSRKRLILDERGDFCEKRGRGSVLLRLEAYARHDREAGHDSGQ